MAPNPTDHQSDTIYALSSGSPPAAIAVVRVSGARAGRIAVALGGPLPPPRRATLRRLRTEHGETLDHALLLWFPAPATATGEHVAELHLHGGRATVAAVCRAIERAGARLADPGEFTRRALLHGRLTLDAAEALADLLAAETETQRREAVLRSEGRLGQMLDGWTSAVILLAARAEAAIDHDEEDGPADATLADAITNVAQEIGAMLGSPAVERLHDGIRVVITGPVNAGKSTLFNALVQAQAAIVSERPGTTRDRIERSVAIGGLPFVFTDTAGRRDTGDVIERAGIARADAAARAADIVIELGAAAWSDRHVLRVSARCDVDLPRTGALAVSAITGEGMPTLIEALLAEARALLPADGEVAVTRRIRAGLAPVAVALSAAASQCDPLLRAEELASARRGLDRLTGRAGLDDVWDALFSRLCLGK